MNDFDLKLYSFVFSLLAILLSIYTAFKGRKRVQVSYPDTYQTIRNIYLPENKSDPAFTGELASFTFIIVNPSPSDIGFFDLMVLDDRNQSMGYLTKINVGLNKSDDSEVFFPQHKVEDNMWCRIGLLDSNYGLFKSNQLTRFEIPVDVSNTPTNNITIRFKIAKETFLPQTLDFKRPRKQFKQYSVTIPFSRD